MTTSRPTERSYRLAPMQHGMLFHSLSAPDEGVYIVQSACELPPDVDLSAFKQAWQSVINRHDILRTGFSWDGLSEPIQKVYEDIPIQIDIEDMTSVPAADQGGLLESYLLRDRKRRFDLSTAPLMRFAIGKMAGDKNLFVWTYHHMLLDGRSMMTVMKEVSLFYDAYCSNQNLELPRPPAYADYIDWFYRQDRSDAGQYWHKLLGTFTTPVKVDLPRGFDEGQSGDRYQAVHLNLSAELKGSLQRLAQSKKLTVNWIVQAAWAVLLARYSGQEDVVYGETRSGRRSDYEEVGSVVGPLINTVPIRLQATATKSFIELLQEVRDQHVEMRAHEGTPLTHIREASGLDRTAELFQTIMVFAEYDLRAELQREGCALWRGSISRLSPVHYPLALIGYSKPDLSIKIDYDRRSYSDEVVERLARHFTALLEGVIKDPHARIADLPLLTNAERQQIVYEWNATEAEYPRDRCVHELFEEQVEKTPDAVAVVYQDAALSYGELNRRADRLAHHLRGLGVGPDARVAICVNRCLEMVVGLLGIMKAGAAYVPLDPAYPAERLSYMVHDSAPAVVLTETALVDVVNTVAGDHQVINIGNAAAFWKELPVAEECKSNGVTPSNLAYLIYTSGSTGSPKGVAIEHRNASALIHWAMKVYTAEELQGVLAATSICFDLSVFELFVTLSRGGKVLLVQDALELVGLPHASEVTLVNTVPSAMAELVRTGAVPASVCTVNLAGEPLQSRLVDQLYEQKTIRRVIDLYGPSEATTYSTYGVRRPLGPATIGRPIANTQVYVLDSEMEPVPVGVNGELYIGGEGLARCYLDRAVATAEKWIPDPFSGRAGGRVYKTGDLGRWREDGTLEFVGRNDLQVKVRGYRIELGEIELALMQHEQVREAVVIAGAGRDEQKQLVAYYTAEPKTGEGELGAEQLREHLLTRLPQYMVPAAYVCLEKLPLTPNGKLDRKGLPAADSDAYVARGYEEPEGDTERALAGIWREVLKVERVGRRDNFFELGGHSLLGMRFISQVRHRLGVEALISELFAHPDLTGFAQVVERAAQTTLPAITRAERGGPLPLSFAQQRLWFLAQMEGGSQAYHIPWRVQLKGKLDGRALRRALDRIVARHEVLRTVFVSIDGDPRQRIHSAHESVFHLVEHDLHEQTDAQEELERVVAQEASATFDLESGPLIRGRLIRVGEEEHALLITMHHIVSDAWSMDVLMNELSVLYGAFARGEEDPLPELSLQYADYAVWQRQWMEGEILRKQAEYWERTLSGAPTLLELPTDHPRPAEQEYAGGWVRVELDEELSRALKELSKKHGMTLYMTLLAGWGALLARLSGQQEVVIGTPVANRGRVEIEGLIGFFVNMLALRLDMSGSPSMGKLLERVKEQTLAAQQHQDIPFEQVVEVVHPVRSLSHSPIFQVMFVWQNAPEAGLELPRLEIEKIESPQMVAKFDLSLSLQESGDRIVGGLRYATALYEQATVERYAEYFGRLLKAVVANPESCIRELPLLSEAERNELLVEWNATEAEYPRDRCVHELFEEQVEKTPDAVAVVYEDATLSYGELNRRANQLAHYLRELGVGPDQRVAICLERSLEMIVGLVGVLKAGGAYVPLDPAYPVERLQHMLEDSNSAVLLTQMDLQGQFDGISETLQMVDLAAGASQWSSRPDTNPDRLSIGVDPEHLAYLIYTSGSTGLSKGVMVYHQSVVNLFYGLKSSVYSRSKAGSLRVSVNGSLSFDTSVKQIIQLLDGHTLEIIPETIRRDSEAMLGMVEERKIDVFDCTPSQLHLLLEGGLVGENIESPQVVLVGGEAIEKSTWERLASSQIRFFNVYGPTECTVDASTSEVRAGEEPSLGRPIANTKVYVLDEDLNPVPCGAAGELYIGGEGVGRGYWKDAGMTAEKFIANPFNTRPGLRLYKTGDQVCYLPDGNIKFLGRIDQQVKLRGYRIEPGEVETRLREYPAIVEAAVVAQGESDADKRLVAYYTGLEIGAKALRDHLSLILPEYMVPVAYVHLESLPLMSNGKLNRRALPAPDSLAFSQRAYEPVVGQTESELARIWAGLLKLERVGRRDNFFELGGHSLLVVRVISRLRAALKIEVMIRDVFEHPVLADLAGALQEAGPATLPAITPAPGGGDYPLSFAQQRLWFLAQMGASEAYHIFYGWRLKGALDREALRRGLDQIVARHEALRTTFIPVEGEPVQRIAAVEECPFHLLEHDLIGASDAQTELDRLVREEEAIEFDLEAGPLIRGRLVRLGEEEHALLITMHHIVSDGWSMDVLMNELSVLYGAYVRGEEDPLPELSLQYADYAIWQRQWIEGEMLRQQAEYWERTLAAAPALLELPTDHPRPAEQDYAGGWVKLELEEELTRGLNELSKKHGTTLYMTLLAGWSALLARLSGQEDIVVGVPVANRGRMEIEGLIGFFVNTLALRLDVSGSLTVRELLNGVKEQVLAGQLHQDIPFEQVVEIVRPVRSLSHSPIFQVMFAWQNAAEAGLELPRLEIEKIESTQMVAKFDLTLSLQEAGDRIVGGLKYATALYEQATVERYAEYFRRLLKEVVANPEICMRELPLLSEAERHELIVEWNATEAEYPREKLVHELFEEQVEKTPDAVAVVYEDATLSYGELNRRANQLAHYLRELGVGPDERVAVCLERSLEMLVGLLAVLKAGGAYLPLDPAYPSDRLRYIVEDSVPAVLLKEGHREGPFTGIENRLPIVDLTGPAVAWSNQPDCNPEPAGIGLTSRELAYVIYTSGSTGTPKGVVIEHHSLVNLICWHCASFDLKSGMRSSSVASFGFDAATWEIWPPLCVGATVLLSSPMEARDPEALLAWWSEKKPDVSFLPTSIAEFALAQGIINPLQRTLLVGGDLLHRLPVKSLPFALINNYGPTETTVVATSGLVELSAEVPSIGRPIANAQIYILDEYQQPVPIGVQGELYIGGAGVGRGYLSRPGQTAERFVVDPFSEEAGARMYRTGDVGRWWADGTIEFLGRNDYQVKIRGYRIELGEIEARLAEHEGVNEAVVVVHEDAPDEKRLVAYYTCLEGTEGEIGAEELRSHLYTKLPKYMVPAAYVRLERLPLSPNGKVDRRGLPAPDGDAYGVRRFEAPVGETETVVARIWADVLKVERLGRYDDFFELGGHSLRAIRFISQLRQALGVEVAIRDLFAHSDLAGFALVVEAAAQTTLPAITPAERGGPLPLSFAQQRLWFLAQMEGVSAAYQIFYGWRLKGLLNYAALRQALDRIVARHEVLRTVFVSIDGDPRQRIHSADESVFHLVEHDLHEQTDAQKELERVVAQEANATFDLESGPLIRGRLVRLGEEEHALLITMHHIVSDGWSMDVLMNELSVLYRAYVRGEEDLLPELKLQYADYAVWQRQWMEGEMLRHQAEYWERTLAAAPALLELPTDHPRPAEQDYAGGWVKLELEEELTRGLNELSKKHGTTLYMTLLAGWSALLARLSGQEDIVVGVPVANRGRMEIEGLIGFFVNTLALRLDVSGSLTVRELLNGVKEQVLAGQLHQDIPFEQVVEIVRPVRSLSHSPIFQVMFAWQNAAEAGLELPRLEIEKIESTQMVAKFDLSLSLQEAGGGIVGGLKYATALYEQATVERYAEYFRRILKEVVANPESCMRELPLLSEAERHELIVEWNATEAEYPRDRCVHELFEEQVEKTPDAVAVVYQDATLSYGELNRRANQLAHHLRGLGVGPDARVAICVNRCLEMVVGLLGIMKAGAAYVPLDPAYPAERLSYMVHNSAPAVVLTETALVEVVNAVAGDHQVINIGKVAAFWKELPVAEECTSNGVSPKNLAYLIYTSGSTGSPKGVAIEHRNASALIHWAMKVYTAEELNGVVAATSICFDLSVFELFVTLSRGGKVLLVQDALELVGLPHASEVTLVNTVPSAMAELVRTGAVPASVCTVNLAGEPLQSRLVDQLYEQKTIRRVIDLYGPSEATTYSTYGVRRPLGPATIGRPIANTQVYVLDTELEPVPVGVLGELYIGGEGLARCYLDRAVATAEKWIPDPFSGRAGGRVYKTGDLGRWREDGTLEFVGRNDLQVKVRGYRIELGEIELALMQHEQVREAVVIAGDGRDEQKQLVAYYTAEPKTGEGELGAEHLREHLLTRLPQYMVPAAYVWLEKLPLTPNGKLDRKGLPAPDSDAYVARGYEEPEGDTEKALAGIWREVLKVERVGRRDNFFELGGHSLLGMRFISQVRHRLGVEALISELFAHPELAGFALVVERAAQTTLPAITVAERGGPLPLSFAQQRLWFLAQMGASEAYHVYFGWRLKGQLDRGALRRALDQIVARHEALRTTFIVIEGQPIQRSAAAEESRFQLVEHDLAGALGAAASLNHLVREEAASEFDLEAGPLIRGRLIRLGEEEHALLITMHHIVSDGWSMSVFIRELSALYGAFARGEEDPLPELEVQYADYAVWQRQWMEGEMLRQQGEYWERTLSGAPTLLELPTDHPRPAEQEYAGGWVRVELDEELSRGLKELSKRHGMTLYMTLLAGWGALLARLSGQQEVVIGTPVANRGRMEIEGLIGFFVNTLALRLDVSGSPSVRELLERVKEQTLAAQQHQDIPFEQVVELARPARSLSHSPIFQVIFAWQNAPEAGLELPRLEIEKLESMQMVAKFDLSLSLQEAGDRIVGGLKYATALYEQATVERHAEYFRRLLKAVVANPESCMRELPLLSEAERNELLVEWNATEAEYPRDRCVHELFEEQVEKTPDAVAVVYEDATLSYGELNRRANRLAHHLRELGVIPGERVAMLLERSTGLVVAQLAVLKSGAAYVPIDPTFPEVRQMMMVRDSGAVVAITSEGRRLSERLAVPQVEIGEQAEGEHRETNPGIETSSEMTAYVMYTSGSTGIPKGVMVPHRAIGRLVLNCGYASFNKDDRVAFASNPAFDASTMEVWGALLNGGSIVVVDREKVLDAGEFEESLKRHGVSVLWMTAGLMNQYAERLGETLGGLRYLIVGGDVLDARVMEGVLRGKAPRHLLNGYGPTETTTFALTHEIRKVTDKTKSIPLGRPIANTQVYIMDGNWEPTPIGVTGELYIGGAGVAEGYLNRPDLTAERFVPDGFGGEPGERMYRTGDLGRWSKEGQIEFEGRNDCQVKIRGFRIELGEIEARLAEHEGVKEAVVVVQGEAAGEKRLVAYYTLAAGSDANNGKVGHELVRAEVLRAELGRKLPEYMVPVAYVRLEKMPLTPNGKLDRKGLPVPEGVEYGVEEYEEPRGEVERTLAEIWAEVLKLERVGRHDNFFELGGHSLLVMSLMNRIRTTMGIRFSIRTLFEAPTVSDLAERLNSPETAHIPLRPTMLQSRIQVE